MTDNITRLRNAPTVGEIAGRNTDPRFFSALSILPNPDPILRRAGRSEDVFDAIQADAHVIGELRSIKADLQRYELKLNAGDDTTRVSRKALELCQGVMARAPAPQMTWPDVLWNMGSAVMRGYSVHEIAWKVENGLWLPESLLDRPTRRFVWGGAGDFRLLTRSNPGLGEAVEDKRFLVCRHMPTYDNPYGVALLSSCFWPYTFKHAGFRWFVKFCERFGVPFPIGKYPAGTPDPQIDALEEALENLIESGYAALQDDGSIELLEAKSTGSGSSLAQKVLIDTCNGEMSKALTSQTLGTEQIKSGSRAAAETHRGREQDVNSAMRESIAFALDQMWRWITDHNFGPDVPSPKTEFVAEEEVSKNRAEVYKIFADLGGRPSRKGMATDLAIELADDADPEDQMSPKPVNPAATSGTGAEFALGNDNPFPDQAQLEAVNLDIQMQPLMESMLRPLDADLRAGLPPEELRDKLASLYTQLDDAALEQLVTRAIFVSEVWGRLNASSP